MYRIGAILDERKQRILKAIVHEYIESAEPVGSEALAVHHDFGVRSATIRNEMAEMAEMGYLRQPHTSAGRVPSDLGYRFYVDRLMGAAFLPRREAARARDSLVSAATEIEHIIGQTCRILTALTHYTSVATPPAAEDTIIRHVSLSKISGQKLLLVVVLSNGRVEHRILDPGRPVSSAEVERASNVVAAQFVGRATESCCADAEATAGQQPVLDIVREAVAAVGEMSESVGDSGASVRVEGTNYILRQPEFKDIEKLEAILAALEERRRLYQFLSRAILGPGVTIVIGTENPYGEMRDASFVASKYRIGDRMVGTIGVLGATRMDYRRATAAVEAMARNLSEVLTVLSLS